MQSDRDLLKQALEALEWCRGEDLAWVNEPEFFTEAITALRERLAQPEQEPVAHSIVAGALFDFMGWLTTRPERLVLSSTDNAGPAADAIKDFAQMRSLSINDAQVQEWQEHLTTPPRREWQGLMDEVDELAREMVKGDKSVNWLARAIEAKLKEKNA